MFKLFVLIVLFSSTIPSLYGQKIERFYDLTEDWNNHCRIVLDDQSHWFYRKGAGFPTSWKEGDQVSIILNDKNFQIKNAKYNDKLEVQLLNPPNTVIQNFTKNNILLSDHSIYNSEKLLDWHINDKMIIGSKDGSTFGDTLINYTKSIQAGYYVRAYVNKLDHYPLAQYQILEVDSTWGDTLLLNNGILLKVYADLHVKCELNTGLMNTLLTRCKIPFIL